MKMIRKQLYLTEKLGAAAPGFILHHLQAI